MLAQKRLGRMEEEERDVQPVGAWHSPHGSRSVLLAETSAGAAVVVRLRSRVYIASFGLRFEAAEDDL